jgi:hypothetical protein
MSGNHGQVYCCYGHDVLIGILEEHVFPLETPWRTESAENE